MANCHTQIPHQQHITHIDLHGMEVSIKETLTFQQISPQGDPKKTKPFEDDKCVQLI